ncbi:TetR/AcrR family transcriptional regulator [Streptomyces fulvoviolaceus]|uniref:TetR/AcrR family transcriptional regulator n=1 Tax=Streptomyces fulvoviolaceus TaxID=285535 RepID=UPI0021BE7482|nr:TetR family transcriptional regulator [Streptomyces fulvoviolaceus]MCT9077467.1 TetR family transcriptional regulator [Streptomyces fulvoviolaceus]
MAGRSVRAEQVRATRELIRNTAERQFAERGVYAVSNRQISEAAGQGNTAVVGYHFGTKADLVRAIARHRTEQLALVSERLLAETGDSTELRDWVACLVRPTTEYLAELGSPTWFARFCAQVMADPALHEILVDETLDAPVWRQILDGLHRCLPDLPAEVRAERTAMTRHLILHMCAERERALAVGAPTPRASWRGAATGLVDAIVGVWTAPVTEGS